MRTTVTCLAVLCLLIGAGGAQAAAPEPFGHACTAQDGIRFCPSATLDQRVPSWDGTPIDIDVSLPPTGDGPFPTIVMLHGLGGSKVAFESTTPEGASPDVWHYNNDFYAQQGYAVVNYSQRGWGNSCGTPASRVGTPACDAGWMHLADQRRHARPAASRRAPGRPGRHRPEVDRRHRHLARRWRLGRAAFMNRSIRRTDGTFAPWRSPAGVALGIAASWPRWQWSDLADSLVPNGRFRDDALSTIPLGASPAGLMKQAFVTGLFALSLTTGYVSPEGVDPSADLIGWYSLLNKGEPYGRGVADVEKDLREYHSVVGLYGRKPAPLLLQDGFTDDLFPAPQALRTYNQLTQATPRSVVSLQLGDLGHGRAQNKVRVNHTFNTQGAAFMAAYLRARAHRRGPGASPCCPRPARPRPRTGRRSPPPAGRPSTGTFSLVRAPAAHHRHPAFTGSTQATQTITSTGGTPAIATALNFPQNNGQTCETFPSTRAPGTAVYERAVTKGFTMIGSPAVRLRARSDGGYPQITARLWDVSPGGSQRLIARGAYRLSGRDAVVRFQLWGNAYRFDRGHRVRMEFLGQDASGVNTIDPVPASAADVFAEAAQLGAVTGNFMRPANGTFDTRLSSVTITLPTRERRPQE